MTGEQAYHHERAHDRHPTGVYITPAQPLPLDPPDDIRAARGIVFGIGLGSLFWAAFAGWMLWR